MSLKLTLALLPYLTSALASPANLQACQTPNAASPLTGCPPSTLFVSPTNPLANYTTIQAAITSLPNTTAPRTIVIDAGTYPEQLNITRPGPTTLLGKTPDPASISANLVKITHSAANPDGAVYPDNAYTATLTVASALNSSLTGSGPSGFPVPAGTPLGSIDFRAYNLNVTNEFAPYSAGPALALSVSYANASLYHCDVSSYQDTVYVGKLGNAYLTSSVIAGQTDFLYGYGTLYVSNGTLRLRSCGGGITAWKGSNTTGFANKYGVYLNANRVVAENETVAQTEKGRCALGRPWNSGHRSVFMGCYLDGTVRGQGYEIWDEGPDSHSIIPGLTLLGEYKDFGPGFNETARVEGNITMELTDQQVAPYRWPKDVFLTPDGKPSDLSWIDAAFLVP